MRLGGMHLIMAYVASIGKLFGDEGLMDIMASSGLFATSSAAALLQGKHYARGLRGLRIVHEAMMHIFLASAESYAKTKGLPWIDDETASLLKELDIGFQEQDKEVLKKVYRNAESRIPVVLDVLPQFKQDGKKQSATFAFWDSFLEAVAILLRLLRADGEADFPLHLNAVLEAVLFFFLAGRVNYSRYAPVYILEMKLLESTQPAMYEHIMRGGFVVRRKTETTFNCVPTDQALEQTINCEAKSEGGIIRFTVRKGALLRWLLTRHITG